MKKFLLLVAASMAVMSQMSAQQLLVAPGASFEKASEDGHYAVFCDQGTLYLLNTETREYDVFEEDEMAGTRYGVGFGHAFSNDNTMVGYVNDYTPAILKDGEWIALPTKDEDKVPGMIHSADAITPDGSRICGGIALASFSLSAKAPMLAPVVWDKQADGSYGMYTVLPYPEKDFTGQVPQYVTARDMSADGKTIVGQVVDNLGYACYPIVYHQDAEGKWSYELYLEDKVFDSSVNIPAFPVYEPMMPDAAEYLDEAGQLLYDSAYQVYMDSVDLFWQTFENYPIEPKVSDFLIGDNKVLYDSLFAKFKEDNQAYQDSLNSFYDAYDTALTGGSFDWNVTCITPDGKYAASTLVQISEPDPWSWGPSIKNYVTRYNFETKTFEVGSQEGLSNNIMADGSVTYAVPLEGSMFNRQAYIMKVGETDGVDMKSYVAAKSELAAQMMEENLTFELMQFDPETGDILEEAKTLLLSGTMYANNDGTLFVSWIYNEGIYDAEWDCLGYVLDLRKSTDGLEQMDAISPITSLCVTDLNGSVVNNNGSVKGLNKGIYLLTATTADGRTKTVKVTKK